MDVLEPPAAEPVARPAWLRARVTVPALLVAAGVLGLLAFGLVMRTASAWSILGAGRGLVPEAWYPYSGFVVVYATTLGQFVGWAGGSVVAAHALSLVLRRPATPGLVRLAMILVYLGLAVLPLSVYHVLFGAPLLGGEREGLETWLLARHSDAYLLLYPLHRVIDLSVAPIGAATVLLLWWLPEERLGTFPVQLLLALLILGTSLAVALSLGIHSVLAHVRL